MSMRTEAQVVDAFRECADPGVLGRMLDILEVHGHAVGATAINARVSIIDGSPKTGRLADVMSTEGVLRIRDKSFRRGDSLQLRTFSSPFTLGLVTTVEYSEICDGFCQYSWMDYYNNPSLQN